VKPVAVPEPALPAVAGPDPKRWWILVVVSLAEFIVGLDATIVNVMGPTLQRSMGMTTTQLQWVISLYVILFGGLLLLGGRLTDVLGRRRVLLTGLLLFTVGSILAGAADGEATLMAARALQGIGAAALSPAALAILVVSFPNVAERTKAFGVWALVIGIGASFGTLLGGAIVNIGWRWAFYINIPVCVLLAVGALILIRGGGPVGPRPKLDVAGALLSTVGMLLLIFGIVNTTIRGWDSVYTIVPLAVSAFFIIAFLRVEATAGQPLLPLRLFRQRTVVASSLGQFIVAGAMMAIFFMIPQYMQAVLGYSAIETGVAYLPTSLAMIVVSVLASQLLPKVGPAALFTTGTVLLGALCLLMLGSSVSAGYWSLLLPVTALLGSGLVLCLVPTPVVGTSQATEADAGTVSAVLNSALQVGGAIGLAVVVTIMNSRLDGAAGEISPTVMNEALHSGFAVLFVWIALAALIGLFGFRGIKITAEQAKAAGAPIVPASGEPTRAQEGVPA
jgi:EmrB/QacA subfamily drug resistance transporter